MIENGPGCGHLSTWRAPLLASFVLLPQEKTGDCVRLGGRNVVVQARGVEDCEIIVLLQLECRLQLAGELSLRVGVAHGSWKNP